VCVCVCLLQGVSLCDSHSASFRVSPIGGFKPLRDDRGKTDGYNYELRASVTAVADEIASAASLIMGKRNRVPVVLVHGCDIEQDKGLARELLRPEKEDLFRRF